MPTLAGYLAINAGGPGSGPRNNAFHRECDKVLRQHGYTNTADYGDMAHYRHRDHKHEIGVGSGTWVQYNRDGGDVSGTKPESLATHLNLMHKGLQP